MMISAKKNSHSMKFGMAVFFWGGMISPTLMIKQ